MLTLCFSFSPRRCALRPSPRVLHWRPVIGHYRSNECYHALYWYASVFLCARFIVQLLASRLRMATNVPATNIRKQYVSMCSMDWRCCARFIPAGSRVITRACSLCLRSALVVVPFLFAHAAAVVTYRQNDYLYFRHYLAQAASMACWAPRKHSASLWTC